MVRSVMAMVLALTASTVMANDDNCRGGACAVGGCYTAGYAASSCAPATCTKTITVPEWYTELVTVKSTEYKHEQRERTINWTVKVPVKSVVPYEYTVCETQWQTKVETYNVQVPVYTDKVETYNVQVPVYTDKTETYNVQVPVYTDKVETYNVQVPVWTDKVETYNVSVPYTVAKQGVRKVAKVIQVQKTYEKCVDQGHWEERAATPACGTGGGCATGYNGGCGSCGGCGGYASACGGCATACATTCSYKVWVSNPVKTLVPYTACETTWADEPYTYNVTECKIEPRTRTVKVCSYATEPRTRTVKVCTYATEPRTRTYKVCTYATEPRTRTVKVCTYATEPRTREVKCAVQVQVKKQGTREVCTWTTENKSKVETYTVCIPYTVEKQVEVKKCRLVCQTVQVPACQTSCYTGSYGCGKGCNKCDD